MKLSELGKWASELDAMTAVVVGTVVLAAVVGIILCMRKLFGDDPK